MSVRFVSSLILVSDIARSRAFYEGLLGQEVQFDHGPNVAYAGGFAIHLADHAYEVFFGQPPPEREEWGCGSGELYFETDDLPALSARLAEAGVRFLHEVREQPWGQRVLRVVDPDGHIVEIGEPMQVVILRMLRQGLSAPETARRTSMPVDIIHQIARTLENADGSETAPEPESAS